jgi:hypothetical protein
VQHNLKLRPCALLSDNLIGTALILQSYGRCIWRSWRRLSSLNVLMDQRFINNQVTVISNNDIKNNSKLFWSVTDNSNSFDLNQAGGVFVFKNQNQATGKSSQLDCEL